MGKKSGPNRENLEATRKIFLNIARSEFAKKGFYGASTADIVNASGMARGSLYYHFGDKKGLFKAVYEEMMIEMRNFIIEGTKDIDDSWEKFDATCQLCLNLGERSELRRIVVDVHTALTYTERFEILSRTLHAEIIAQLKVLINKGFFKGHKPETLAMIIFGIISETVRSFELSKDVSETRKTLGATISLFLSNARGS